MPPIYHITHVGNLQKIIDCGGLWSDRRMAPLLDGHVVIGFPHIKSRRLYRYGVPCFPGTTVGDFVPFYFCPRSPMLYIIERRRSELEYKGGQKEVIHLVSSVEAVVAGGCQCAFTATNAGAGYTYFHSNLDQLEDIVDWSSVEATDWRDPAVKEKKQAEFLVRNEFPWKLIESIGVFNTDIRDRVTTILQKSGHRPNVSVQRGWYY